MSDRTPPEAIDVRATHTPESRGLYCDLCAQPWPCEAIAAAEALERAEEHLRHAFRLADDLGVLLRLPYDCGASHELRALRDIVEPGWRTEYDPTPKGDGHGR